MTSWERRLMHIDDIAYQRGQEAKAQGKPKRSNPYRSAEFRNAWSAGWSSKPKEEDHGLTAGHRLNQGLPKGGHQ